MYYPRPRTVRNSLKWLMIRKMVFWLWCSNVRSRIWRSHREGRHRMRWEHNIKLGLKEIGKRTMAYTLWRIRIRMIRISLRGKEHENVDCIQMLQDRVQWYDIVKTVMDTCFHKWLGCYWLTERYSVSKEEFYSMISVIIYQWHFESKYICKERRITEISCYFMYNCWRNVSMWEDATT
jgi:hypothetical protein